MIINTTNGHVDITEINKLINNGKDFAEEEERNPDNNVVVVSETDNLVHNYFHYFERTFDDMNCLSVCALKFPKTNEENLSYWLNYQGNIAVYIGNNIKFDNVEIPTPNQITTNSTNIEDLSSITPATTGETNSGRFFDTLNLTPVFKGSISSITEEGSDMLIRVDSIGKRFKQKIPKEFREAYIFNQNVRDAFQAICEFLGVYYVCPPPMPKDEDSESETDESTIAQSAAQLGAETESVIYKRRQEALLKKYARLSEKNKTLLNSNNSSSSNNNKNNIKNTDNNTNEDNTENEIEQTEQEMAENIIINGYGDVAFDAGGMITIGGTVIEDSPNIAETLLQMENIPSIDYDTIDPTVKMDLQKLFNGKFFEELHNNIMDYSAITITPGEASSSEMSSTGGSVGGNSGNSDSNSGGIPYWKKAGFSSLESYDKYQAQKNSSGYSYYILTRDKGWQKVIYRRYIYAFEKGWVTRMDKNNIKGKTHGSTKPLWKYVLKI